MRACIGLTAAAVALGAVVQAVAQEAQTQQAPPPSSSSQPAQSSSGSASSASSLPPVIVIAPKKPSASKKKQHIPKKNTFSDSPKTAASKPVALPASPSEQPGGEDAVSAATLLPPPGTLISPQTGMQATTVTTARDIVPTHGATLTDTLDQQPGVGGSTFAPGTNRPIVRGLDNNRVRVQENGVSTGDVSDISEDHAYPIDPYSADSVTVIRGPETVRYGSQAIGGVVSAENQRIPTYMPEGGFTAQIMGGLSSVDNGSDGAFKVTAGSQGFVMHADGFDRHASDYDTPEGRQKIHSSTATALRSAARIFGTTASSA